MNPIMVAVRAGLFRGRTELRNSFTNAQDLWTYFFPTVILLVVMFFMRDATVPGTGFSLGARTLPGTLGMGLVFSGLLGVGDSSPSNARTAPCCGPRRSPTACWAT
ncbi:hypothetical protein GCM10027605_56570 [Micromonospora zhanjiangensis]